MKFENVIIGLAALSIFALSYVLMVQNETLLGQQILIRKMAASRGCLLDVDKAASDALKLERERHEKHKVKVTYN